MQFGQMMNDLAMSASEHPPLRQMSGEIAVLQPVVVEIIQTRVRERRVEAALIRQINRVGVLAD
jgi:hypothetical protein